MISWLQLERDTRTLVNHLGDLTTRTVRDKFARLNQVGALALSKPRCSLMVILLFDLASSTCAAGRLWLC